MAGHNRPLDSAFFIPPSSFVLPGALCSKPGGMGTVWRRYGGDMGEIWAGHMNEEGRRQNRRSGFRREAVLSLQGRHEGGLRVSCISSRNAENGRLRTRGTLVAVWYHHGPGMVP